MLYGAWSRRERRGLSDIRRRLDRIFVFLFFLKKGEVKRRNSRSQWRNAKAKSNLRGSRGNVIQHVETLYSNEGNDGIAVKAQLCRREFVKSSIVDDDGIDAILIPTTLVTVQHVLLGLLTAVAEPIRDPNKSAYKCTGYLPNPKYVLSLEVAALQGLWRLVLNS